ncbi:hypothetical protein HN011_010393 [Eciton burchellii]|nr:hypothetical protein HN011_010393 [Eciton burchellii]
MLETWSIPWYSASPRRSSLEPSNQFNRSVIARTNSAIRQEVGIHTTRTKTSSRPQLVWKNHREEESLCDRDVISLAESLEGEESREAAKRSDWIQTCETEVRDNIIWENPHAKKLF